MIRIKNYLEKNSEKVKLIIMIAATAISMVFILISRNQEKSEEQAQYTSLMVESRYIEAAKVSPEHLQRIEEEIASKGEDGIDELKVLVEKYPDLHTAKFDLAYLEENYDRVIELQHIAESKVRKKHLAIAYIQTGQLKEADQINQEIQDEEISKMLQFELQK